MVMSPSAHASEDQHEACCYHEAVLSAIPDAVFLVDSDGNVIYANSGLQELTGISCSDVIKQPYSVLFQQLATLGGKSSLSAMQAAMDKLDCSPILDLGWRADASRRLRMQLIPIPSHHENGTGNRRWCGIVQDVSAEHDKLMQRTRVLPILADELRSSLVFVRGWIATLASDHGSWEGPRQRELLERLTTNTERAIELLENVREVARLELGEVELDRRPINLKSLVSSVVRRLQKQINHVPLTCDFADGLLVVNVDPMRASHTLESLLKCLINEASRGSEIRITTRAVEDEVRISMAERRQSLSRTLQEPHFDSLFSTSERHWQTKDLELELCVAQGVLQAHGGRIWIEESDQQGLAIHLALHAAADPTAGHQPRPSGDGDAYPMPEMETAWQNGKWAKILVVEDDTLMMRFLKVQLELAGFEIIASAEGKQALELAAIEMPDLVLLDIYLPDSNGFEICTQLRTFTSAPIIMFTASTKEEDMVHGLSVGADDYITKPPRKNELLARVNACLRRSSHARLAEDNGQEKPFRIGQLVIDFAQRNVMVRGQPISLTPTEYKLLHCLAMNAGRILTHEQLVAKVWGPVFKQETQYLWVNISRLRSKIEKDPRNPEYILSERGVGYYLAAPN